MSATVTINVVFSPVFLAIFNYPERDMILSKTDANINGLLFCLSRESTGKIDKLVFEKDRNLISTALMIQVNDRTYTGNALNQQPLPLKDQDTVSLLYYVSGG